MDIIEAIKLAERGKLITNGIYWMSGYYLNYVAAGVFEIHKVVGDEMTQLWGNVSAFSMAHILANDWRVVNELKLDK